MPLSPQELLLTALDQRYEKYLLEHKRCVDEFSEEAVHDLRVATRRLLALIELLRALAPHPRLQKLRRACKDQLDDLDDLRDTQVMLAEIAEMLETLPTLAPLQKFLQKRERRLLKAAAREVRDFNLDAVAHRLGNTRAEIADPAFGQDLMAQLFAVIDDTYLTVTQRKGHVDPARPPTIHRVRVAFKKFRYMVEIIYPILPKYPETFLKWMHDYQTAMGEIQDVEVFLHTLAEFANEHKSYDPTPVLHFYEQRHAEVIAAYIAKMNELATFWRETPKSRFSWNRKTKDKQL
jgi:CHAD domain-containing protein